MGIEKSISIHFSMINLLLEIKESLDFATFFVV